MKIDLLSIPIAITTFVSAQEPISIFTNLGEQKVSYPFPCEEFTYFSPIKTNPLLDIENKIHSFKSLPTNWDGRGGITPNQNTIKNSLSFISSLPETTFVGLNIDDIVATPYGTIVFDITVNNNLVSVEIGESKIGFFTDFVDGSDVPALESAIFNQNTLPLELRTALNQLFLQEAEA